MSLKTITQAVEETAGKIFSITFVKKDGTLREMLCRLNVSKDVKGTNPEANSKRIETLTKNGMVTVFDMVKKGYRVINLTTVKSLTLNKVVYTF